VDQARQRHLKTFQRKRDADVFEAAATVEVREGTHTADSASISIAEAGRQWLVSCEQAGLERSTLAQYRQHLDLHIVPHLGALKLSQLSAPLVRQFEDDLRSGKPPSGSASAVVRSSALAKKVLVSLGSLVADAQERGRVSRNVVREVRSKRKRGKERLAGRRHKGKLKVGIDIPMPVEIKALVASLRGRMRPILITAIFTGLRASELRGLRWLDVDFASQELHVRQRADRYKEIGKPKSEASERSVPMPPIVANTLREWKLACPKGELELVFPTARGRVEDHKNIVRYGLIPAQLTAGVAVPLIDAEGRRAVDADGRPVMRAKYTGLHALRHFYASWCINRRADGGLELPPKVVQERLGHSSIVMTMDVYGHLFRGATTRPSSRRRRRRFWAERDTSAT
jgi:integrase